MSYRARLQNNASGGGFAMKPEFEMVYESTPEDAPRSRLEPYQELILRWRRQGRTYRRIQKLLVEKFAVQTSTTTLFKFVKSRSKPRKPKTDDGLEQQIPEAASRNCQSSRQHQELPPISHRGQPSNGLVSHLSAISPRSNRDRLSCRSFSTTRTKPQQPWCCS